MFRFSWPTPGLLGRRRPTAFSEGLLNKYFRLVFIHVLEQQGGSFFVHLLLFLLKRIHLRGIRLIDSECPLYLVCLARPDEACVYAQLETFMSWPTHLSRDWLSSLPRPFPIRNSRLLFFFRLLPHVVKACGRREKLFIYVFER